MNQSAGELQIMHRNNIQNYTNEILKEIQSKMNPISYQSLSSNEIQANLHLLDTRKTTYDQMDQQNFPNQMKNQEVCRLGVRTLENYDEALKDLRVIFNPIESQQKLIESKLTPQLLSSKITDVKKSPHLKEYEKNYRNYLAYLSRKELLIIQGGKSESLIKVEEYSNFIIQTKQEYNKLLQKVFEQIIKIKKQMKGEKKSLFESLFNKMNINLTGVADEKINQIWEQAFPLLQIWSEDHEESEIRIISIYDREKRRAIPNCNFCIYFTDYVEESQRVYLDRHDSEEIVEKLTVAHLSAKNSSRINEISQAYKEKTKQELIKKTVMTALANDYLDVAEEEIVLQNSDKIFHNYQKQHTKQLIQKWKDRSLQEKNNSKQFLLIEPRSISLPKSWAAKKITLTMPSNKNKNHEIFFKFEQQKDSSLVFIPDLSKSKSQKYCVEFPEKKRNQLVDFLVVVQIDEKEKKKFGGKSEVKLENGIRISADENEELGFAYELALDTENNEKLEENFKGNFPYVLAFQAVMITRGPSQLDNINVHNFRSVNLLSKLGKIPNVYSRVFKFDYNPNIFPLVSSIFFDKSPPLDKRSFERTYLQFTYFFQHQQNLSQNYCEYLSQRGYGKVQESGFQMQDRFTRYKEILQKDIEDVRSDWMNKFHDKNFPTISKICKNKHQANMKDDMEKCSYKFPMEKKEMIQEILEKYLVFCDYDNQNRKDGEVRLGYCAGLIKVADFIIEIYERSVNLRASQRVDPLELFCFFTAFLKRIYPYHQNIQTIQNDMYHVRALLQKYLPQFNRKLNRKGMGLENYISSHMISFFTLLPMELCFRVWDFLVKHSKYQQNKLQPEIGSKNQPNNNKALKCRIICFFTFLIFQQKSDLLPIIPINTFIESVETNLHKYKLQTSAVHHFSTNMHEFIKKRKTRRTKIQDFGQERFIRRFIFGRNIKQIQLLDEEQFDRKLQRRNKNNNLNNISSNPSSKSTPNKRNSGENEKIHNQLMSINQLSYPLPKPNHQGFRVFRVCIFLSGVFILRKLNFHGKKYQVKVTPKDCSGSLKSSLKNKNTFVNEILVLDISADRKPPEEINFQLLENKSPIMRQTIHLQNYHKDTVYRESLTLHEGIKSSGVGDDSRISNNNGNDKQEELKNNLGTSVITFSLLLQTEKKRNLSEEGEDLLEDVDRREGQIFQKLLDYDINHKNNDIVSAMRKVDKNFEKIMDALDEMDEEKVKNLKISASFNNKGEAQWINNSKVTVEQLKAIFNYIFTEQSQKQYKLQYPHFYEDFAEGNQKFDLGKFLFQLTLLSPITKNKKMSLMYCLAVHYQNITNKSNTQKMTIETLNSMIREIFLSHGVLNACPFSEKSFGEIISGCMYLKGDKVEEQKKDITKVLQDWAYICQVRSKYQGIILGTADQLSVLRAMLPAKVLREVQEGKFCRFQIVYRKGEDQYVWAATVNSEDFSVAKRGVKFLNSYPVYNQLNQSLNSVAETLYNCENLIPLQNTSSISYEQFCQIFRESPLLSYLLNIDLQTTSSSSSSLHHQSQRKKYALKFEPSVRESSYNARRQVGADLGQNEPQNQQEQQQQQLYTDFGIFRNQNCLMEWRRCKVLKDQGKTMVSVRFKDLPGEYEVPRYELICMDENMEEFGEASYSQSMMESAL